MQYVCDNTSKGQIKVFAEARCHLHTSGESCTAVCALMCIMFAMNSPKPNLKVCRSCRCQLHTSGKSRIGHNIYLIYVWK